MPAKILIFCNSAKQSNDFLPEKLHKSTRTQVIQLHSTQSYMQYTLHL